MKRILTTLIILSSLGSQAQETLTLEGAIGLALQHNHQIQIQQNQQAIAANSVHPGNAGLLPGVSVGGSYGGSVSNTDLEFAGSIPPTSIDGALSSTLSGNATVNYVLFDGFNGRYAYQKLKLNKLAVDAQSRASIEATILQVAQAYYQVLQNDDQVRIAEENAAISAERYQRAKAGNELGVRTRSELLAARVDLTSDSSALLTAQLQASNARRILERIIGADLEADRSLAPITLDVHDWTLQGLEEAALQHNALVKNLELQHELAKKDLQASWSSVFPTLSVSGGYAYTNQQSEAGIVLSNVNNGWNGSVGLTYPLFSGFKNTIQRQNAEVQLKNSALMLEDQKWQLKTDLANAFAAYRQSVKVVSFEEQNLASSELNLERAEALWKAGQMTATEFREAQLGFISAQIRISNAKVAMKLNELQVLQLTGQILSNEG